MIKPSEFIELLEDRITELQAINHNAHENITGKVDTSENEKKIETLEAVKYAFED